MPVLLEPKKIVLITGKLTDVDSGKPVHAWVKIKYRPTKQDMAITETRPNGSYRIAFAPQKDLVLMIYTDPANYYPYYESLKLDLKKENQVLIRNIEMGIGKKPVLKSLGIKF